MPRGPHGPIVAPWLLQRRKCRMCGPRITCSFLSSTRTHSRRAHTSRSSQECGPQNMSRPHGSGVARRSKRLVAGGTRRPVVGGVGNPIPGWPAAGVGWAFSSCATLATDEGGGESVARTHCHMQCPPLQRTVAFRFRARRSMQRSQTLIAKLPRAVPTSRQRARSASPQAVLSYSSDGRSAAASCTSGATCCYGSSLPFCGGACQSSRSLWRASSRRRSRREKP